MSEPKQAKFTNGPWSCKQTGDGKRYIIGAGQSAWGTHVAEVYADDTDADEAAANAALVKSAPDLFAALKDLLAISGYTYMDDKELQYEYEAGNEGMPPIIKARAALKKAVGE